MTTAARLRHASVILLDFVPRSKAVIIPIDTAAIKAKYLEMSSKPLTPVNVVVNIEKKVAESE